MRAIVSQGWSFIFVFQLLTRLLTGNLEDVDGEHEDNQACPVWVDKRKAKALEPGPGQRGRWWPWGRGPSPPIQPQGFPSLGSPNGAPGLVRVVGIRKWKLCACRQPISKAFCGFQMFTVLGKIKFLDSKLANRSLQNSHRRHSILSPEKRDIAKL